MRTHHALIVSVLLAAFPLTACKKDEKPVLGKAETKVDPKADPKVNPTPPETKPTPKEPEAPPPAAKAELPAGTALGACPAASSVKEATSVLDTFKEAGPIDWSTIKTAKALIQREGTQLQLFLSNTAISSEDLNRVVLRLPVTEKGQAILQISFSNGTDKVGIGKYDPAAGYGKPMWVSADLLVPVGEKGTSLSLSVSKGSATIVDSTAGKVCGTFELTGESGTAKGEFVADLEKP